MLQLAAKRASKIGLPIGGNREAEDERLDVLVDWANNAFEPLGMDGLNPNSIGLFTSICVFAFDSCVSSLFYWQ